MCGLYSKKTTHEAVREFFSEDWEWTESADLYDPSATVGPSAKGPGSESNIRLVALHKDGSTRFGTMRWRYEMSWMREKGVKVPINAKLETLFSNGLFKHSAKSRRCLVIVDGFYEPKGQAVRGQKREQYRFTFDDGRPFALGGIWANYRDEEDEFAGFAIVTTRPGAEVAPIHQRSPVILDTPADRETWLEGSQDDVMLFEQSIDRPDLVSERVEGLYGRG